MEPILIEYEDQIEKYGFRTGRLAYLQYAGLDIKFNYPFAAITDFGRLNENFVYVYGIQPNEIMNDERSLEYSSPESGLSVTEQLYTARGSQGAGMMDWLAYDVAGDPSLYNSTYAFQQIGQY